VRNQTVTHRTACKHGSAIVAICPKCKRRSTFVRATLQHIDTCGFESHSFCWEWCANLSAGILDPSDGELVLSLLEEVM
jgi:hypothetical protein